MKKVSFKALPITGPDKKYFDEIKSTSMKPSVINGIPVVAALVSQYFNFIPFCLALGTAAYITDDKFDPIAKGSKPSHSISKLKSIMGRLKGLEEGYKGDKADKAELFNLEEGMIRCAGVLDFKGMRESLISQQAIRAEMVKDADNGVAIYKQSNELVDEFVAWEEVSRKGMVDEAVYIIAAVSFLASQVLPATFKYIAESTKYSYGHSTAMSMLGVANIICPAAAIGVVISSLLPDYQRPFAELARINMIKEEQEPAKER